MVASQNEPMPSALICAPSTSSVASANGDFELQSMNHDSAKPHLEESQEEPKQNLEIGDSHLTDNRLEHSHWPSILLAVFLMFLTGIQFSVYLSSLWPYMTELDETSTQVFFGITIAAYSVGQTISAPFFGFWSNKYKVTKIPIMFGIFINMLGNLIYSFVQTFPTNRKWILLIARIITGIGGGMPSVLRAYVAEASHPKDRMKAIALATGAVSLGFVIGPALQVLFTPIGFPGYAYGGFLYVNVYTAPGYFVVLLGIVMEVLMVTIFKERYPGVYNAGSKKDGEAIGAPFTMAMFSWSKSKAVLYNGIIYACSGLMSFAVYAVIGCFLSKRLNRRASIVTGFALLFAYYVVSFPWPGLQGYPNFQLTKIRNTARKPVNFTAAGPEAMLDYLASTELPFAVNSTLSLLPESVVETVGCDPSFDWCRYTPRVNLYQYLVATALASLGFPSANVMISVLFSLIVGPRRQGTMQGIYTMAGSCGRTVAPVAVSYLFSNFGPRVAWALIGGIMAMTLLLLSLTYRRLVPLDTNPKLKAGDRFEYKLGYVYRL